MFMYNSVKWIITLWISWVQLTTEARFFYFAIYIGHAQAG